MKILEYEFRRFGNVGIFNRPADEIFTTLNALDKDMLGSYEEDSD